MADRTDSKLERIVLERIKLAGSDGCSPKDLHTALTLDGKPSAAIRDTVSRLWDEGEIKLGSDRKLRVSK